MLNQKILINCLLLSQCSGGYKSYFKNVIIPLADNLNTNKVIKKLSKESYTTKYAEMYYQINHQ